MIQVLEMGLQVQSSKMKKQQLSLLHFVPQLHPEALKITQSMDYKHVNLLEVAVYNVLSTDETIGFRPLWAISARKHSSAISKSS
jgi:hypothetical protein